MFLNHCKEFLFSPILILVVSWFLYAISLALPFITIDFWARAQNPTYLYGWQTALVIFSAIPELELAPILLSLCNIMMLISPFIILRRKSSSGLYFYTGFIFLLLAIYAWIPMLYSIKYSDLLPGYYTWATSLVLASIGLLLKSYKTKNQEQDDNHL